MELGLIFIGSMVVMGIASAFFGCEMKDLDNKDKDGLVVVYLTRWSDRSWEANTGEGICFCILADTEDEAVIFAERGMLERGYDKVEIKVYN